MTASSLRLLACLALLAIALTTVQAFTVGECAARQQQDKARCERESLPFCERWVCFQNVNRKYRMCDATANTGSYSSMKSACDDQQRTNPGQTQCEFPVGSGTFIDAGIWYNKAWCNRTKSPVESQLITSTVHAESDALNAIITNRTAQAEELIKNTECIDGAPTDPKLPDCVCLPIVPKSCTNEVRRDVVAADPDRFPTPSFEQTVAQILVNDFNYTPEDASNAATGSTCQRYPNLDECKGIPSPAPARRLLQPYYTP